MAHIVNFRYTLPSADVAIPTAAEEYTDWNTARLTDMADYNVSIAFEISSDSLVVNAIHTADTEADWDAYYTFMYEGVGTAAMQSIVNRCDAAQIVMEKIVNDVVVAADLTAE